MASLNKVMLIGNLTRDPELRALPSGINVADLRLAINETYTDKSGQKVEKACFVDVAVWDKQADLCKTYLSKGSPILVEGRLQMDEWTTKEGEKRSKLRVRADRFQFLGAKKGGAEGSSATNEQSRQFQGRPSASSPREDMGAPVDLGEQATPADGDSPF
jgi:single-strand DNA-binding protein